jgi:BAG domain.
MMNFFSTPSPMFSARKDMFTSPQWEYSSSPSRSFRRNAGEGRNFPLYFTDARPQQRYKRDTFIDPDYYYDPLFGGTQRCDCRDCQMERYFKNKENVKPANFKDKEVVSSLGNSNFNSLETQDSSNHQVQNNPNENKNVEVEEENSKDMNTGAESDREPDIDDKNTQSEDITVFSNDEQGNYQCDEDREKMNQDGVGNETSNIQEIEKDESAKDIERKIKLINVIKSEVEELHEKVKGISTAANVKNYDYLYCEEMLVKCLLKLDEILTEGEEEIRAARKNVVNEINNTLSFLEMKANKKTEEKED